MVGTLVAVKDKLELRWSALEYGQFAALSAAIAGDFFPVTYTDAAGVTVTKTMYAGDLSGKQYSWAEGLQYVTDVSLSLIER
jgi:hypothetical protein